MRRIFDNVISVFVIIIVLMIIIPLPAIMLDILLLVNISLSLIILLITMNIKESLEFSIFPSLLLITTIYRLSLNISSTKLILGEGGQAGAVIAAFGNFVIGGNAIVGFIIFLIILFIQFLVITKGAERVAEVSARFTLDAMPGKQMAIDADLNTGMITEQQARERREKISREAEFYGAMDGATKFVKGDAIISIIVTIINLVGGLIIGSLNGVEDVLSTYTIATVGDGLVSQIPSLLISTATGMIVTRAASENSLGKDVLNQFSQIPVAYVITGALMLAMSLIPGFPPEVLIILGGGLLALGIVQLINKRKAEKPPVSPLDMEGAEDTMTEAEFLSKTENIYSFINVEPITVEFGYSLLSLIDDKQGSNFEGRLRNVRKNFASEMGIVIPTISLVDNIRLSPSDYVIKIKDEEVASGTVLPGYYLVMDAAGLFENVNGIDTIEPTFGIPAKWVPANTIDRPEMMGYSVIEPQSVIITHLTETIRKHAYELVGREELQQLLENVKQTHKVLVEEVVGPIVPPSVLNKIIVNLLKEDIPVKDLVTILEVSANYAEVTKNNSDLMTEFVRQALKRTITRKYTEDGIMRVISLDTELENTISKSLQINASGNYLALDHITMQNILVSLKENLMKLDEIGATHIVMTSPGVRLYFKQFIERFFPDVVVLSIEEIDSKIEFQTLGVVRAS